ncbi:MAG: alpha/beta fold hydrolase [Candidatus Thiodiazotropha sp. (ex Myrtea spinifera)]|nr:alpha/beta fold hydrolase [Candidatus Thiodiazotropha sp. (ex Myrtea spinifera)]MCU7827902.1 alpha/beta fold hydrolase [Candidatus Thiodiazotropha sp. (ex Myrtea sp. 'scaly one' KF741663)]
MKRFFALLLLFSVSMISRADVVLLVHGYLGSAGSWETSGVSWALERQGWQRAGLMTPRGLIPASDAKAANKFYTVDLLSMAPIGFQAEQLRRMISLVERRHPGEPVTLVGHSAGGVVSRMVLVQGGVKNPKALITIASPHLGTLRAIEALEETDDPFPISVVKEFFAGDLYGVVRDSWEVLLDLTPEQPGNLLFWLNRQPHPEIEYISVVRPGPIGAGDELVPAFSQDMNQVQSLKGKSRVVTTPVSHALQSSDGRLLVELLAE